MSEVPRPPRAQSLAAALRAAPAPVDPVLRAVHAAFADAIERRTAVRNLPAKSLHARTAVQLHQILLLCGAAIALGDRDGLDRAGALLAHLDTYELQPDTDEVFVAYLAVGLVAFEDLAGPSLPAGDRTRLQTLIAYCDAWLQGARSTRPYGTRNTPGNHAWNHSVIAALAGATTALDSPPGRERDESIDFGLARLDRYFAEGLAGGGAPYEGWTYWGQSLRVVGLFSFLCRRDPAVAARLAAIREKHASRLQGVLDWLEASRFPKHPALISWNQSQYRAKEALGGLLLFYGEDGPQASELWRRIVGSAGDPTRPRALMTWPLFEARLLLQPASGERPPAPRDLVDLDSGYALLADGRGHQANRLFVRSGRLLEGPHNQSDTNHFTWLAGGFPYFIDRGAEKVAMAGEVVTVGNRSLALLEGSGLSSFGHNAVLVGGRGQHPCGTGGRLAAPRGRRGVTLLTGTATEAYNRFEYNPVRHAYRHWALRRGEFPWLFVFDDIRRHDWHLHAFERRLLLPESVITELPDAAVSADDALTLQFAGRQRKLQLRRGAYGPTQRSREVRPGPEPFGRITVLGDRLDARNPCFWMLAWPEADATPAWRIAATPGGETWTFAIDGGDLAVTLEIDLAGVVPGLGPEIRVR